ncbi:hypothetical protein ACFFQW_34980 [Umezawaea endophytica]|uniref:Uncharacterized protein n=1 Tax=Umezawaea endophytica TaxID=1654476 RepID=A0A9X3AIZ0_9PSEU|nr:hypothetical protein [Umezawaea endophytica]MCS7483752.1 hypothetical protein [Umezawaea endophytica]
MLRTEVDLLVRLLDTFTDGPMAEAWHDHRETITGYEALMRSDHRDRDSTS